MAITSSRPDAPSHAPSPYGLENRRRAAPLGWRCPSRPLPRALLLAVLVTGQLLWGGAAADAAHSDSLHSESLSTESPSAESPNAENLREESSGVENRRGVANEGPSTAAAEAARLLSGTFSSAAQAAADEGFFDIRLVVVPIWKGRDDGPWLYVEQAAASALEQPYRQRVYRLVEEAGGEGANGEKVAVPGTVRSVVYTLPEDPLEYAGAFREDEPLAQLTPEDLAEREGCDILLRRRDDGRWEGATGERSCPSSLRGASFATSEVVLEEGLLVSWDRGFDAVGEQVWGATEGGYRFVREEAP